jgi:hypothetical protein
MNIGISFGVNDNKFNIWSDGEIQKIFFLYFLLKKIPDVNTYIVNFGVPIDTLDTDIPDLFKNVEFVDPVNDIHFDLFIEMGKKLSNEYFTVLKLCKTKIVLFKIENAFISDSEDILFENKKSIIAYDDYDEIWSFSNNEKLNKYYLENLYKKEVKFLPYIWDNFFIKKYEESMIDNDVKLQYSDVKYNRKNRGGVDITIFEENNTILKNSLHSILLVEKLYNLRPELIDKVRVLNSYKFYKNPRFLSFVNTLKLKQDNKITFEERYTTPFILSNYTDIVVSNQFENDLSNTYFDCLYTKFPLVHNSPKINTLYYYPEFNLSEGSNKLLQAITKHQSFVNKYNDQCDNILNIYSIDNENIIEEYEKCIFNIIKS